MIMDDLITLKDIYFDEAGCWGTDTKSDESFYVYQYEDYLTDSTKNKIKNVVLSLVENLSFKDLVKLGTDISSGLYEPLQKEEFGYTGGLSDE